MKIGLLVIALLLVGAPTYAAVDVQEIYKTLDMYSLQYTMLEKMHWRLSMYYIANQGTVTPFEQQTIEKYLVTSEKSLNELSTWIPALYELTNQSVATNDWNELEDIATQHKDVAHELKKVAEIG